MKLDIYPYKFKLKRFGRIRRPTYEIYLAVNRVFKERIGVYNTESPREVFVFYNFNRFLNWISRGARPGKSPQIRRIFVKLLRLSVLYIKKAL